MSINASYLASRCSMTHLAGRYGLDLGPALSDLPENGRPWMAELSNGWTIYWVPEPEAFHLHGINPHFACNRGEPSYAVSVAEFCMHSSIARYVSSAKVWSVIHRGDGNDPEHLKITGKPPKVFAQMRDEVLAKQRNQTALDVSAAGPAAPEELRLIARNFGATVAPWGSRTVDHVFGLPIRLGQHFFGFSHDQVPPSGLVMSCREVLGDRPRSGRKASFWVRLWRRLVGPGTERA